MIPSKIRKIDSSSYLVAHQELSVPEQILYTIIDHEKTSTSSASRVSAVSCGLTAPREISPRIEDDIIDPISIDGPVAGGHCDEISIVSERQKGINPHCEFNEVKAEVTILPMHPETECATTDNLGDIIDVLSDDEYTTSIGKPPECGNVMTLDSDDEETIFVVDDDETVKEDIKSIRSLRMRENPDLITEPDHPDTPREHNLDMEWPVALLIHSYIYPSEDFDICLRNSTLDPSTRFRLATAIDEINEIWIAGLVSSDTSQLRIREAGRFPLIASAVLECLNASGLKFTSRFNLLTAHGQQEHSGIFIDYPAEVIPVTVKIYSNCGAEIISQILINRIWSTYIRRRFSDEDLTIVSVNPECLTRAMVSINLYARDCLISALVSRGMGPQKQPNMECAFQKDRRFYNSAWNENTINRGPGRFGWSALPHGLLTFSSFQSQLLPLYSYDSNGSEPLWIQAAYVKEPSAISNDSDDHEDSDDDLVHQIVRSSSKANAMMNPPPQVVRAEDSFENLADLLNCNNYESMPEYNETIDGLTTELLPHQKKGVYWMINMEKQARISPKGVLEKNGKWYAWSYDHEYELAKHPSYDEIVPAASLYQPRGGILADEMGLGKTVQVLALILADRSTIDENTTPKENDLDHQTDARNWLGAFGSPEMDQMVKESTDLSPCGSAEDCGTLVVCPLSVLTSWKTIIKDITNISDSMITIFHGSTKVTETIESLKSKLIVLTTYNIVAAKDPTLLHKVTWKRIVLDEAHQIRNWAAVTTTGCLALTGRLKWCLTGTPIQNKLLDLQPLLEFIDWIPFNNRKRGKLLLTRWQSSERNVKLKLAIQPICLRRTKQVLACDDSSNKPLNLPEKTIDIIKIPMNETEMKRYQALNEMSKQAVRNMGSNETAKLWTVLTNLRLMASTEEILSPKVRLTLDNFLSYRADQRAALIDKLLDAENLQELINGVSDICPICLDPNPDIITKCKHAFHSKCFKNWLGNCNKPCPICRTSLDQKCLVKTRDVKARAKEIKNSHVEDHVGAEIKRSAPESSKVQQLCDQIAVLLTEDPTSKIVAFSSFVKVIYQLSFHSFLATETYQRCPCPKSC